MKNLFKKIFQIIIRSAKNFINTRAQEAAASLAFYAVFSLFPLLIIVGSVTSFLVDEKIIENFITQNVNSIFPISQSLLLPNIEKVLQVHSGIGIVGALALIWISTNFFHILTNNINLAWSNAPRRNFFKNRFIALVIAVLFALLIIPPIIATSLVNLISRLQMPFWIALSQNAAFVIRFLSKIIPFVLRCLIFLGLYIWIPNTRVKKSSAMWGALCASLLWEIVTAGFILYLRVGFVRYDLIYGSLGAIFTLNLWIFLCSSIILYGAHLSFVLSSDVEK
jgi:membrane protein